MHFCDNPADLMFYHNLVDDDGNMMDVTEVEDLSDKPEEKDDDYAKKYCTTKLKIGAKISFCNWVKAAVEFVIKKTKPSRKTAASGNYAQLAASGYSAKLAASGNYAQLAASGYYAQLAASGDSAQLAASGDYAQLAASGYYAQLAASGYSIVAGIGINNIAKAEKGSWIVLAEWIDGKPVCVKARKVDGKKIKANTFYRLKDGKFEVA